MKQTPIKLGPLALLLTVISICLTMLSILSFTTARADMRLAEKYAETVSTRYELETEGQQYLADVRGTVPVIAADALADTEQDDSGIVWKQFDRDGAMLRVGVDPADGFRVVSWKHSKEWEEDTDIGMLWPGL